MHVNSTYFLQQRWHSENVVIIEIPQANCIWFGRLSKFLIADPLPFLRESKFEYNMHGCDVNTESKCYFVTLTH